MSVESGDITVSPAAAFAKLPDREQRAAVAAGPQAAKEATALKLTAERKAGALPAGMELKPWRKGNGDTLSSIGISNQQSSRWQRVALVPERNSAGYGSIESSSLYPLPLD